MVDRQSANGGGAPILRLKVMEPAGLTRTRAPVRTGIPLPRGFVREVSELKLEDAAGNALPLQARALVRWSDGSVQWVLVDTQVSIAAYATLVLRLEQGMAIPMEQPLLVTEGPVAITVRTGAATFRVPRQGSVLLESVQIEDVEQLTPEGLAFTFLEGKGRARTAVILALRVEEDGPLRAAVVVEGHITGTDRRRPMEFLARLGFTAGSSVLDLDFRLRNPRRARHRGGLWDLGDPGSQYIRELALVLTPAAAPARLRYCTEAGQSPREAADLASWVLYQDSSGGEHWDSPNHLGADGKSTVSFRGYQLRGLGGTVLECGDRATPCMELVAGNSAIACSVEGFWQNFPKALRLVDGRLHAVLFPREARCPTELQGGEQKRHRLWFAFGAPGEAFEAIVRQHHPLQVKLDPQAVQASHAIHGFTAACGEDDPRHATYLHTIIDGEHSFFKGREAIDEYGWRNFGDVYADHEAVHHKGPGPFISHYNNQYDVVLGTLLQGLRSDDPRWFELAGDLARHVMDIDIYHTQDDKPAYNGGLFWHSDHYLPAGLATHRTYSRINANGNYGGGPDNEQNYTSGLLLWYYLTGDPQGLESVRSLAEFVIAMDDGNRTIFRLFDKGPTGNASKTVSMDYHGPGRGAGNSINALLDAFWLTRERRYLVKAEELVQRCIHPLDDIAALKLDEPEYRWSYMVFLQVLDKYLMLKEELDETGHEFRHARDSLLHYAQWMLEHERPYSEQLQKVLLPTETWPAQDVRKARVLAAASRYCADHAMAKVMQAQSKHYQGRALHDTLAFPSAYLVRPRVLLAVYGACAWSEIPKTQWRATGDHDPPQPFEPQRHRVVRRLKALLRGRNTH